MTEKSFWENADTSGGGNSCWNWKRAKFDGGGYGSAVFNGKQWRAHRLAYKFRFGDFDKSLSVCHCCDNPSCVNPAHLFLGTTKDNQRDMIKKGRKNPSRGSLNGRAKLNESQVHEIKKLKGIESILKTAKRFGVCFQHIYQIQKSSCWKHVILILILISISANAKTTIDYEKLADAIRVHENSKKFEYGCEHKVNGKLQGYSENIAREKCIALCKKVYSNWNGKGDYFQSINKIYAADKTWYLDVEKLYNQENKTNQK